MKIGGARKNPATLMAGSEKKRYLDKLPSCGTRNPRELRKFCWEGLTIPESMMGGRRKILVRCLKRF